MKLKLLSLALITLISSCTIATPEGEYKFKLDEFDHTLVGDFDINIKGQNNQPRDTCPTKGKGNTYYVAIAYERPIGETCTLEGVTYSISPIQFRTLQSAKDFADRRAYELRIDTIYGTRDETTSPNQD